MTNDTRIWDTENTQCHRHESVGCGNHRMTDDMKTGKTQCQGDSRAWDVEITERQKRHEDTGNEKHVMSQTTHGMWKYRMSQTTWGRAWDKWEKHSVTGGPNKILMNSAFGIEINKTHEVIHDIRAQEFRTVFHHDNVNERIHTPSRHVRRQFTILLHTAAWSAGGDFWRYRGDQSRFPQNSGNHGTRQDIHLPRTSERNPIKGPIAVAGKYGDIVTELLYKFKGWSEKVATSLGGELMWSKLELSCWQVILPIPSQKVPVSTTLTFGCD